MFFSETRWDIKGFLAAFQIFLLNSLFKVFFIYLLLFCDDVKKDSRLKAKDRSKDWTFKAKAQGLKS